MSRETKSGGSRRALCSFSARQRRLLRTSRSIFSQGRGFGVDSVCSKDPSAEDAAKAVQLLFRLDKKQSIANALSAGPKGKADAIAKLVGFIQTPEAKKLLEEYKATNKPASTVAVAAPALLATPEDIALLAKREGNPVSGKAVFQKLCFACHKAGDVGIDFGPGLSDIGSKLPKTEPLFGHRQAKRRCQFRL